MRVEINQGSREWLAWRRSAVGSSDAASLVLDSEHPYGESADVVWERKLGLRGPVEENYHMRRGRELEHRARAMLCRGFNLTLRPDCFQLGALPIVASLDAYGGGVSIEIKCCGEKNHQAFSLAPPKVYLVQVAHQQLVVGAFHYLFFFHPDLEPALFRVSASLDWLRDLLRLELLFVEALSYNKRPSDKNEFVSLSLSLRESLSENIRVVREKFFA